MQHAPSPAIAAAPPPFLRRRDLRAILLHPFTATVLLLAGGLVVVGGADILVAYYLIPFAALLDLTLSGRALRPLADPGLREELALTALPARDYLRPRVSAWFRAGFPLAVVGSALFALVTMALKPADPYQFDQTRWAILDAVARCVLVNFMLAIGAPVVFGAQLIALRMECRARNAGLAGASGRTILLAGAFFAASLVALIGLAIVSRSRALEGAIPLIGLVAYLAEMRVARIAWSALVGDYYEFAPTGSPD